MIDVYAVRLNFQEKINPEVLERLLNCVAPRKKERLKRFYHREDTLRGLFADLLIRDVIIQKTGLNNEDISFTTNDYGKPFLKDRNDVQFNLSHSGVWVVGVIDHQIVGIDVERVQEIDLDISKNYFSPDEHEDLMSKGDKFDYFFTLWALKESYIKILGKGLSHPLNAFSIKFTSTGEIIIKVEGQRVGDIFFRQYDIDKAYKMAVCAAHDQIPGHVNMVTTEELIKNFLDY
ncbi:MAG: 4'-phosphopantetheinyl transferase superfamily protein [Candidatus Aminicenantes bacterium]|jgi:4'-phosphopantetheinyl transferase